MVDKKKSSKRATGVDSAPKAPGAATDTKSKMEEPKEFKAEEPKVAPPPPPVKQLLVTFNRWFNTRSREKGWKPHWAAGMKAYANTSGRLPMSGWDELFKRY